MIVLQIYMNGYSEYLGHSRNCHVWHVTRILPDTNFQTLSTHIRHGTYPPEETCVTYCYPPIPRPACGDNEAMRPLDSRREIFRCYEAFKEIVGI